MAVFHCPVYSMSPDLSSSAIHRALLNLTALTCTKQGCRNDIHTITSYVSGQGIYPWGESHCVALILGLGRQEPMLCQTEECHAGEEEML